MPTMSEKVVNRALSGEELQRLLLADFERLLANEGMLSPHIAFGRVAYTIQLTLHLDNALHPKSESSLESKPVDKQAALKTPALSAVEKPPLQNPSQNIFTTGKTLKRKIDSPNAERLRNEMPVPIDVRQADSTIVTEMAKYPKDDSLGEGNVEVTDNE